MSTACVLVVIAGFWYGLDWWRVGRFTETTDDAYVGGNVTVISPHVAGYVAKILVKDNQFVHAGVPLVRLEERDYRTLLDAADADVAAHQAALRRLRAQHELEQALIRKAAADLAAKRASEAFDVLNAKRYRRLAQSHAGSQQQAQHTRAELQVARAAVESAAADLEAARKQLVVIETQIGEAQANLIQAMASRHMAQLNLSYTELCAPIDGYVSDRSAHPGTYVVAGTPLLSLVPAHGLWVDANFKEDQIHRIMAGDPVDIVADVWPSKTFHGTVESLSPAPGAVFSVIPPQNATGNFTKIVQRVPVRIRLDGKAGTLGILRAGLSVTVSVETRDSRRRT